MSGRIDFSKYENLQPIYTEYNIGYYRRSFSLSPSSIDEHKDHSRYEGWRPVSSVSVYDPAAAVAVLFVAMYPLNFSVGTYWSLSIAETGCQ